MSSTTTAMHVASAALLLALAASSHADAQQSGGTQPASPPSLYNAAQAARGERVYQNVCIECHEKLEYTGPDFRLKWNGRPAFDLVDLIRSTMPDENPGTLPTQDYVDVVGYMMKLNGVPAGKTALPVENEALKKLKVEIPK